MAPGLDVARIGDDATLGLRHLVVVFYQSSSSTPVGDKHEPMSSAIPISRGLRIGTR
jgi:hypothetical protein